MSKIGAEVTAGLAQAQHVTVGVMLRKPLDTRAVDLHQYRNSIARSVDQALAVLPAGSYVLRRRFKNVSALTMDISAEALPALERSAKVVRVDVDVSGGAQMLQAAPLAHVSEVRTRGFTGKNVKTAVIDSGAQLDHPDLAANGTVLTASAGSAGSGTSISAPACISGVIAVGAVWDADMGSQTFLGCTDSTTAADKPTCFTNSNALMKLYAPGAYTTATGAAIDQATTNYASTYGGTSQAAPLVAARIADLFQLKPALSAAEIERALTSSRTRVIDPESGLSFPRLDCDQALVHIDRIFASGLESDT